MSRAYIAFGANLSNPRQTLMAVIALLGERGVIIERVSNLWRSQAWPPGTNAPDYENAVMSVRTAQNPSVLMTMLLQIETTLGRVRSVQNAPRSCDLDLIDFDGQIRDDPHCILPHPRLQDRDFVLLPLKEVADPDWVHPISQRSVDTLLERLAQDCET